MRAFLSVMMALAMTAAVWAQEGGDSTETRASKATAARILAIGDDSAASAALADALREILNEEERAATGEAELTIGYLVESNPDRAMAILPGTFKALAGTVPLAAFQRLAAAALVAAGTNGPALTQNLLDALEGQPRWATAVLAAARDTPGSLPPTLYRTLLQLSSVVLPPVVIIPRGEEPAPAPRYQGQ